MTGTGQLYEQIRLFEFRDAWTMYRPDSPSEADKLNGAQSAGTVLLGYSAFREFNLIKGSPYGWYPFQPGINRSEVEVKAKDPYWKTWLSWSLQKRNGQWSFASPWGTVLNPDSIAASKRSCSALTGADPFAAK